jgi:hypothetical protein
MGRQVIAGHTFAFARTGDIQALNRARLSCGVVASRRRKLRRMVSSESRNAAISVSPAAVIPTEVAAPPPPEAAPQHGLLGFGKNERQGRPKARALAILTRQHDVISGQRAARSTPSEIGDHKTHLPR